MWKCIEIQDKNYAILSRKENHIYKISLTDFISIWSEELIIETIIERCKTLNPLLKIESLNVDEIIGEILSEISEISEFTEESNICKLTLYKKIKGGKFKFELNLHKATDEVFFETITKSICSLTVDLFRKYSALKKIVKEKDEEIAEYKAEGAQLIRKNIETKPFSEDSLKSHGIAKGSSESLFKSLVNLCNEAEKLCLQRNIRCPEKSESCTISEEVKIKTKEVCEAPESNLLKIVSSDAGVSTNDNLEDSKHNQDQFVITKKKVKRISASVTKPVKKVKNRVNNFIS